MNGWMEELMDGWMEGGIEGIISEWTGGRTDIWMGGQMDGWKNADGLKPRKIASMTRQREGRMDRRVKEYRWI